MALTLQEVAQTFLADDEYQRTRQQLVVSRDKSINVLQPLTLRFVRGEINLQSFRTQLERTLRAVEDWGATSFGFMMELNKLGKYHDEHDPIGETALREALTGLNAENMGRRIEQFYNFLLVERDRLRREGKSSGMTVVASHSAFIISLFAFWLDPSGRPIIYYDSLRKGLYLLIQAHLLSPSSGLKMSTNAVEVRTEADHLACLELINIIEHEAPQLVINSYWPESFCFWVTEHVQSLTDPTTTLFKETDEAELLARTASKGAAKAVNDGASNYTLSLPEGSPTASNAETLLIAHEPLHPTAEPLLTELVREVQKYILVDEAVIRRIYHALLAGHVILTGPPGTGKTELARIVPEILWKSKGKPEAEEQGSGEQDGATLTTRTAYTTRIVTATDEWSVRTLIGGIAPRSHNGTVSYSIQYGYLTTTILKNWSFDPNKPEEWNTLRRTIVTAPGSIDRSIPQPFRGQWLVIDEFNRAPIDLALGDALTALGGNDVLRVPIDGGSAELPIPQDFRVIGTLNSFDRNYLNQISEALKRRFSFIEILPPPRTQRAAEQGIVLYKALNRVKHLTNAISIGVEDELYWQGVLVTGFDPSILYAVLWDDKQHAFHEAFEVAWRIFEVIRIYRQLGTAQAISLVRYMLIAGLMQQHTTQEAWMEALDAALCDTLADQLQVLLPDEVEALLLYLTTDRANFSEAYHRLLSRLSSTPQRLYGQLLSLSSVSNGSGQPILSDEEVEEIASQNHPTIPAAKLSELFHLGHVVPKLPQFTRRLRAFKAERGL